MGWIEQWIGDDVIDELISLNRSRSRPGMERPDLAILARHGAQVWRERVAAQERLEAAEVGRARVGDEAGGPAPARSTSGGGDHA